jgi:hypothetical protein
MSIDVGIKTLAINVMTCTNENDLSTFKVLLWNIYNVMESEDHTCKGIQKNGNTCNKQCVKKWKTKDSELYSCKSHFPKDILSTKKNIFKKKLLKNFLLQDIATNIVEKIQEIYAENNEIFKSVDQILIELQPKCNYKMTFASHIIYAILVSFKLQSTIRFVRASQKLKAYTGPPIHCTLKGGYAQRKWLAVQYCKYFLENKLNLDTRWIELFEKEKKKDDLSVLFLLI